MRRKPKQPTRVRAKIRAAAREHGGPLFVAASTRDDGSSAAPARLMNLGNAGPYLEGVEVVPGVKARAEGTPLSRDRRPGETSIDENADAWQNEIGRNDEAFAEEHAP